MRQYKISGLIKIVFLQQRHFLVAIFQNISMNHRKCKVILQVVKINSNNPYNIEMNKCSGSCHNTNDSYSELGVSNAVKNLKCYEGFIWNPRNCVCQCDKPCDVAEYLDHENCKLVDKLVNNAAKILMKMK